MKQSTTLNLLLFIVLSLIFLTETGLCEDDSIIVTPNGNVGIGITDPQNKLHINGNIQAKEVVLENSGKTVGSAATNGTIARSNEGNIVVGKNNIWTQIATPVGSIIIWPSITPPAGYKECNGDEVSQSTYPELLAALGDTWERDNTKGTFRLPDFRGEFLRGWDHGKGVDSGREICKFQDQELKSHQHMMDHIGGGYANYGRGDRIYSEHGKGVTTGNTRMTSFVGGNETRPRNVSVMFCIKVK